MAFHVLIESSPLLHRTISLDVVSTHLHRWTDRFTCCQSVLRNQNTWYPRGLDSLLPTVPWHCRLFSYLSMLYEPKITDGYVPVLHTNLLISLLNLWIVSRTSRIICRIKGMFFFVQHSELWICDPVSPWWKLVRGRVFIRCSLSIKRSRRATVHIPGDLCLRCLLSICLYYFRRSSVSFNPQLPRLDWKLTVYDC